MLDLQDIEVIEEAASSTGQTVHAAKRALRWYSPSLEYFVISVAERRGLDSNEVRAWYRDSHRGYLERYSVKKKIESRIAKRQHRKVISDLLSA